MPIDSGATDVRPARAQRGQRNYLAGTAAEHSVERAYCDAGCVLLERRWRGQGGEIDLIFSCATGEIVFVEVKKSRSFDQALEMITPRQVARIHAAAEEYLDTCPQGQLSETRFDAAVVDEVGRVEVHENVLLGY